MATAQRVEYLGFRCTSAGCSGTLECDGYEQFVMRMKGSVAFGLEILYEHADNVADGGVAWHKFWRRQLTKYRTYVPHTSTPHPA